MSFDRLGLSPELLRAVAHEGYTEPTPVQAQAIPLVLAGRDLLAGAQTGHRQDRRVRAADAPAPPRVATRRRPARCIRALDPHPDPRARAPGRGERPHLRRPAARSARPRSTAASASIRRSARCAPGRRSSSPRPAACSTTSASGPSTSSHGRDPRPRRGRPDARHGLHPRHPQDPRAPAAAPPEPALLGHVLGRDPARWPTGSSTTRRRSRSRRATPPTELVSQVVHPVDRERKRELLSHLIKTRPDRPGARLHPHQARRQPAGGPARATTASPRPRSTATRASRSGSARSTTSRPAGSPSSSRPRSPRAASTSRRCRTSSTSSCRWCPRTTSTASAGRAAPASTATPSRSSASTRRRLLRDIERVLGRGDPARDHRGLRARPAHPPGADPARRVGRFATVRSVDGGGAASHGCSATCAGAPRPSAAAPAPGTARAMGAPRPGGQRPGGTHPGGSRPGNRGAGFAGPRRPGQSIGNGAGPRPAGSDGRSGPRSPGGHGGPRQDRGLSHGGPRQDRGQGYGGPRPSSAPGTILPGERLARQGDRPRD